MLLTFNIIIIGMKHSGKTTLGKRLAAECRTLFHDLDDMIESLFAEGGERKTCREIFTCLGKDGFAVLEAEAAGGLAQKLAEPVFSVAALGGGAAENRAALERLFGRGKFVYISEEASILYERIMQRGIPPFLNPDDPWGSFEELMKRRTDIYTHIADMTIPMCGAEQEEAFSIFKEKLEEAGYVR